MTGAAVLAYADIGARALLCAVFVAALAGKVRGRAAFGAFAASLSGLGPAAHRARTPLAAAVVGAEAGAAVLLAVPAAGPAGYALAVAVLAAFSAGIAYALRTGRVVRCRCFGADAGPLDRRHLMRNGALAALGIAGIAAWPLARYDAVAPGPAVAVAALSVLLAVCLTRLDDLAYLFTPR